MIYRGEYVQQPLGWNVCVQSLPKMKFYVYLNLALGFSKTPMKALLFYVQMHVKILQNFWHQDLYIS
jgi:hypothetical protein